MIRRPQLKQRLVSALVRGTAVPLLLAVGLTGCHHKVVRRPLPVGALAPVELETVPPPATQPLIASLPPPVLEPLPPPPPPKPAPKRRSSPREEPPPAPAQPVESASVTAAIAIGALTTGGDVTPQSQQEARDLIASILRRIAALPPNVASAQKKQIKQIDNFLDQARKALDSGDADGAKNLATKAKLLMDDLEKK